MNNHEVHLGSSTLTAESLAEAPEARRERLIANGYKTDSRCTWLAIGKCPECGRVHDRFSAIRKADPK